MVRVAVHLHLFYLEQLDDLLSRLQNLSDYPYDLFVTMVENSAEAKKKILAFKADAKIWSVPNLGYDIGPFVDFLHRINLDEYDFILKIHTKRTQSDTGCFFKGHRFNMWVWREMLLDATISKKAVKKAIALFKGNDNIGMIGSDYILTDEIWAYDIVEANIATEMANIGLKMPKDKHFVAGTMFWVRAKLLKPFLAYKIEDFTISDKQIHDKTLAHVLERMFGFAVNAQGYIIKGVHYKTFYMAFMRDSVKRFLFQKKVTNAGYLMIKICKIPVYRRKETK